jgi:hypothetical protein
VEWDEKVEYRDGKELGCAAGAEEPKLSYYPKAILRQGYAEVRICSEGILNVTEVIALLRCIRWFGGNLFISGY